MKPVLIACLALLPFGPVPAAADPLGQREYLDNCAVCHGREGAGDGPLGAVMTVEVPDLTGLAARSGGVFPMTEVIAVVDGREALPAHGFPMPVWGRRFELDAGAVTATDPTRAELEVRGRLLSLALYLESIQQ